MNNSETNILELNNETIESMIYDIRGVKVIFDYDLARIYGYTTKAINQQVQRNKDKFPDDFIIKLKSEEWDYFLRSQIVTANNRSKTRVTPYAFTEQGVYMLMTVLKGDLATKQSIALIKAFKQMKDYLVESNNLLSFDNLLEITNKNTTDIKEIKKKLEVVMDNFIDPSTYKHFAIYKGERIEADIAYQTIYKMAKYSIHIIDDYIDIKTLQLLKCCNSSISISIISDNKAKCGITKKIYDDFIKDTNINLTIRENKISHDRYILQLI